MKDINKLIEEKFQDKNFQLDFLSSETFSRLADELLILRKKRGVTQKQLADMIGTTQAVISRLENASVKASLETVVKIAKAMNALVDIKLIPVEDTKGNEISNLKVYQDVIERIEGYKQLSQLVRENRMNNRKIKTKMIMTTVINNTASTSTSSKK